MNLLEQLLGIGSSTGSFFTKKADLSRHVIEKQKNFFEKPYKPRTGIYDLTIYPSVNTGLKPGDRVKFVFKDKQAYLREEELLVAVRYGGKYIYVFHGNTMEDDTPISRMIRAHFNDYKVKATVMNVDWGIDLECVLVKDGEELRQKVERKKSDVMTGQFELRGFKYVPGDTAGEIRRSLKPGDKVVLKPDHTNPSDKSAIKVEFKDKQIGWMDREYYRKDYLYKALSEGRTIHAECVINEARKQYIETYDKEKEEWVGGYGSEYQYIEIAYTLKKE